MSYTVDWIEKNLGILDSTLDRYEKAGFIKSVESSEGNKRRFDEENIALAWHIKFFVKIGYSHKEIIKMNSNPDFDHNKTTKQKLQKFEKELAQIKRLIKFVKTEKASDLFPKGFTDDEDTTVYEIKQLENMGVTRRMYEHYEKEGVICFEKNPNNERRIYDKKTIEKILLINFLVKSGYSVKQAGEMLASPDFDFHQAVKDKLKKLKKDRKDLTEQISCIKFIRIFSVIPACPFDEAPVDFDGYIREFYKDYSLKAFPGTLEFYNMIELLNSTPDDYVKELFDFLMPVLEESFEKYSDKEKDWYDEDDPWVRERIFAFIDCHSLWQCGKLDYEDYRKAVEAFAYETDLHIFENIYVIFEYIERKDDVTPEEAEKIENMLAVECIRLLVKCVYKLFRKSDLEYTMAFYRFCREMSSLSHLEANSSEAQAAVKKLYDFEKSYYQKQGTEITPVSFAELSSIKFGVSSLTVTVEKILGKDVCKFIAKAVDCFGERTQQQEDGKQSGQSENAEQTPSSDSGEKSR